MEILYGFSSLQQHIYSVCANLQNKANVKLIYVLFLVCFLGSNQVVLAQEGKSTITLLSPVSQEDQSKLSAQNSSTFERFKRSEVYKQVQLVKVGNLAKIQKKGILTFAVPGFEKSVTFFSKTVEARSEADFKWVGASADKLSTAIFISKNGNLSGAFNINERSFQLFSAGDELSMLLEDRTDLGLQCNVEGHAFTSKENTLTKLTNGQPSGARAGVCTEPVRVLVLFTQNAANSVPDINAVIDLSIQQYNTTINNSGIGGIPQTNFIQEAGRQLVTFTSNSPEQTPLAEEAAARVRDDATVQNLRNQFQADLVVCLVEHTYDQNAIGSVTTVPAFNSEYAAIVRAPFASNAANFTFTHEVGHLMGGRHEITADGNGPAYSHGFLFTTNPPAPGTPTQVRTMMHRAFGGSTRIMHYSNPNVNFDGAPTGTFDINHVARRISEVSPTIVTFRPSVTQPFNAYIDGPDNISQSGYYNWELLTFCRNFSTTEWRFSADGFNYGPPVGAGDAVNFYYVDGNNNGTLYLRCTIVTDQGQTYVTTKTINVNVCPGCRVAFASNGEEPVRVNELTSVFPNPADKKIAVSYSLYQRSDVDVEFVDLIGRRTLTKSIKDAPPAVTPRSLMCPT